MLGSSRSVTKCDVQQRFSWQSQRRRSSAPDQARADGYVTPWAGVNFAGGSNRQRPRRVRRAGRRDGRRHHRRRSGLRLARARSVRKNDFGNNSVINLMGNVIIGMPIGGTHGAGFRPLRQRRRRPDAHADRRQHRLAEASSTNNCRLGPRRGAMGILQRSRRPPRRHPLLPRHDAA